MGNVELTLSPSGSLLLEPTDDTAGWPESDRFSTELAQALSRSTGEGLLWLGRLRNEQELPAEAAYWRRFARAWLTAVCLNPELEQQREKLRVPFPHESMREWPEQAPPMRGGEYLSPEVLAHGWEQLNTAFAAHAAAFEGSMQELLGSWDPVLHVIGRVYFHLAENKNDAERPFAFLATYTSGVSAAGKAQHVKLKHALEEYAGARNKAALARLLTPVSEAAKESAFVKELVESGRLFRPLALTPTEAYRFLRDIPVCERAGLLCRVPDWWKARSRVQVGVSVGSKGPAGLGLDALVSFSVDVALDGEPLDPHEWKQIAKQSEGLALIRGRWVELDGARLKEVLTHWRKVEKAASDGLSFGEAMRMLAGLDQHAHRQPGGVDNEWVDVQAGTWLREVLEKLRNPEAVGNMKVKSGFKATLRPYQEVGFRWMWFLQSLGLGACLADDMGLGKTVQVLALLHNLYEPKRSPSLLVVPASLLGNWQAECARFAPKLPVSFVHPSMGECSPRDWKNQALVVTTYNYLVRTPSLGKQRWDLVILDEAQAVKNPGTRQSQAVKALNCRTRVALTGTPIENRLTDLWSLFDFLNPGLLGSLKAFERLAKKESVAAGHAAVRQLVRPYILRRMKTDKAIISDLPDKTEMTAFCRLSKPQAVLYQKSIDELARKLETVDGMERRGLVLAYLQRLKQICNHPSQWLGDEHFKPADSGKFARLAELCGPIAARQEKALIFTQFQTMTEPLRRYLESVFRRQGLVLHGATPVKERKALVERFQQDERVGFFVISVKAGGVGLNLTAASHVVHFDRWWNPAVENQATDRAYRIGQKNPVVVHKFVCKGTLEERIDAMLQSKRQLADNVLAGTGEALLTELGNAELMQVLSLDAAALEAV